jgi:hypothetical protein
MDFKNIIICRFGSWNSYGPEAHIAETGIDEYLCAVNLVPFLEPFWYECLKYVSYVASAYPLNKLMQWRRRKLDER